jgi:hypothetical protein
LLLGEGVILSQHFTPLSPTSYKYNYKLPKVNHLKQEYIKENRILREWQLAGRGLKEEYK